MFATLPVLARGDGLVVVDKPAGLPSSPPKRGGDSVEARLAAARPRGFLCHRLDTDTAGCLAVALSRRALRDAQQAFANGAAVKVYWAVVVGRPAAADGVIDAPLVKRSTLAEGWRMAIAPDGKPARTRWRVLRAGADMSVLELVLDTGRTHQARAHCAALGHPVLGDPRYGGPPGPMMLLARRLALCGLEAVAPVPPRMALALDRFHRA